jgi:hypothetical protein
MAADTARASYAVSARNAVSALRIVANAVSALSALKIVASVVNVLRIVVSKYPPAEPGALV